MGGNLEEPPKHRSKTLNTLAKPTPESSFLEIVREYIIWLGPFVGGLVYLLQQTKPIWPDFGVSNLSVSQIVLIALAVQAVTIALILCLPPALPSITDAKEFEHAIEASHQFISFWILIWVAWLGLYCVWGVYWKQVALGTVPEGIHFVLDLCNMLSAGFFLLCYFSMVLTTVPPKQFGWNGVVIQVLVGSASIIVLEGAIAYLHSNYDPKPAAIYVGNGIGIF
jgi:hypothetical protein